jgi:23S rRNA (cytidine1920-2'-O)/16S rRNA (cytidine1409-2'-O)-methyltransferase
VLNVLMGTKSIIFLSIPTPIHTLKWARDKLTECYNSFMSLERLDVLVFTTGLVESRSLAQRFIMAGQVRVNGEIVSKPGTKVSTDAILYIDQGPRYVSRGGEKLAAGLEQFSVGVEGLTCADIGASTGGFTDCLLQHGAAKVYAIDVGKGILHWKIRQDPRVVVMEQTNARYVSNLPEPIDLVTTDASFISLKILLPVIRDWFSPPTALNLDEEQPPVDLYGQVIALVKPQFEAGKAVAARGKGVVRDPAVHQQVLIDVLDFACQLGFGIRGLTRSPLLGPKGNVEFLAWLQLPYKTFDPVALMISRALGFDG